MFGKKDKHYHLNNNSSTHKSQKNNNNINYYYSNTKNRYIYYKHNINNNSSIKNDNDKYEISKEHKDISANLSFITITDTYNLNSQKKKEKRNNIKLIDSTIKRNIMRNQKDIDDYQNKNLGKNKLSHIKYNSCINAKITNINLYDEKSFGIKKEINTSHKTKHHMEKENNVNNNNNDNNNIQNYYTNIIFNKQKKNEKCDENVSNNNNNKVVNNNIIIKINLVSRKLDNINRNRLFQRHPDDMQRGDIVLVQFGMNIFPELSDDDTGKHFAMIWARQGLNFIVIPLTKHFYNSRLVVDLGIIPNMPNGINTYAKIDFVFLSISRISSVLPNGYRASIFSSFV